MKRKLAERSCRSCGVKFSNNLVENRGSDWNRCDLSPKTFQFFTISDGVTAELNGVNKIYSNYIMNKKSENPYENHSIMMDEILRKKHKCKTFWGFEDKDRESNGEPKLNARMVEYYENDDCPNYCEYCMGYSYNQYFQEKPTQTEINEVIMKNRLKGDIAINVKRKKYRDLQLDGSQEGQLITLCIDKEYIQVPKLAEEIISVIRSSNYECLIDAVASIELYGKTQEFAPHIHLVTRKVKKAGYVAQLFRRKFQKDKYQIYRVDVKDLTYANGREYIYGVKKCDNKNESTELDKIYRKANNLLDVYEI